MKQQVERLPNSEEQDQRYQRQNPALPGDPLPDWAFLLSACSNRHGLLWLIVQAFGGVGVDGLEFSGWKKP